MYFFNLFTLLSTAVFVTAVPAATLEERARNILQINEFSFSHPPHGEYAYISFNVTDANAGLSNVQCSQDIVPPNNNGLGPVPLTQCINHAVTFLVNQGPKGYTFQVNRTTTSKVSGSHFFANSRVAYFSSPPGSGETWGYMNTSSAFNIPYSIVTS